MHVDTEYSLSLEKKEEKQKEREKIQLGSK